MRTEIAGLPKGDVALAVGLGLVKLALVASGATMEGTALPGTYLAAVLLTAPLAWRTRRPFAVAVLCAVALGGEVLLLGFEHAVIAVDSVLVASYSVAAHSDRRSAAVAGAAALLLGGSVSTVGEPGAWAANVAIGAAFVLVPWLGGMALRSQRLLAQHLERDRDGRARAAVAGERARLARDLHDEIAHSVTVIAVQADAAEAALARDPELARAPLVAIRNTATAALGELRRTLGVLRSDEPAARSPGPSLSRVGVLVEQASTAALEIELEIEGEPDTLPPMLDGTAFRVIQEGLTNVRKHAASATTGHVVVRYLPERIELEVSDNGRSSELRAGGHGLLGMRERVTLLGGELHADSHPDGFVLRVTLPRP